MNTPAFVGRTDAELERILAARCLECGSRYPVAADPKNCAPLELRDIETLDIDLMDSLIRMHKLGEEGRHFICGGCLYPLTGD